MVEDKKQQEITAEETPVEVPQKSKGRRMLRSEWFWLGLIIVWALVVRLVKLNEIPVHLMCDEADNLGDALKILYGHGPGLYHFDWKPSPAFSVYLMAGFLKVLGVSRWAMRFPSVLISVLALIPFYYLTRRAVSQIAALVATFLLANGVWYLHFSRSGWENIHICFYALMAFWLVVKAKESKFWYLFYGGSGVFAGIGILAYFSGKTILPAVLMMLPLYLIIDIKHWLKHIIGFAILASVALLIAFPHLKIANLPQNKDFAKRRIANVYIFNNPEGEVGTKTEVITRQCVKNICGFFDPQLSNQPRYGRVRKAPIDYVTGALFAIGLFISLFYWRVSWLWWMLFLSHFSLQVLTRGTPDPARGVGMIPPIYFFAALTIDKLRPFWFGLKQKKVPVLLLAVSLAVSYYNIQQYFAWCQTDDAIRNRHPYVFNQDFDVWLKAQREYLETQGRVFNLDQWEKKLRQEYLDREQLQDAVKPPRDKGGLTMKIYEGNNWSGKVVQEVKEAPLNMPEQPPRGSFSIEWTGFIFIPRSEGYRFTLRSDDGSHLFIDGEEIVDNGGHHGVESVSGSVELEEGWRDIEVKYFQDDGAYVFSIFWTPPGGEQAPIPSGFFSPTKGS